MNDFRGKCFVFVLAKLYAHLIRMKVGRVFVHRFFSSFVSRLCFNILSNPTALHCYKSRICLRFVRPLCIVRFRICLLLQVCYTFWSELGMRFFDLSTVFTPPPHRIRMQPSRRPWTAASGVVFVNDICFFLL